MDEKQQLQGALRPALRRIAFRHYAQWMLRGLVFGLGAAGGLLVVSRFVPVADSLFRSGVLMLIVITLFLAGAWQKRPGYWEAALAADQTGLRERAATAWEFQECSDPLMARQRVDALSFLEKMDNRGIPLRLKSLREPGIALALLLAVMVLAFWPNPVDKVAEARKQERLALAEARKEVGELRRQVEKDEKIPGEMRKQLDAELKKLEQKLAEAGSLDKGAAALAKEEAEVVRRLSQEDIKSKLAAVAVMLKENPRTAAAGKALEKGGLKDFKQQMETLAASVKELDAAERKSLAAMMADLAKNMKKKDDTKLADSLKKSAGEIESGGSREQGSIDELKEQIAGQLADAQAAEQLAGDLKAALGRAKEGMLARGGSGGQSRTAMNGGSGLGSGSEGSSGGNGNAGGTAGGNAGGAAGTGAGGQGGTDGTGAAGAGGQGAAGATGSGGDSASGSGSGSGSGPGSGSGGSGTGSGSGAGTGSTNTDGGSHSGGGASSGSGQYWGTAPDNEGQYEVIYVPTRLGSDGQPDYVGGTPGDLGTSVSVDMENGPLTGGRLLPYSEVLSQYESEAMQGLEKQYVPENMKDMVREYFMGLAGE